MLKLSKRRLWNARFWWNFVENEPSKNFYYSKHASRKPEPGEPSSLENLEQTEILPEKVYQTENFREQTEILTEQTEILVDQDTWFRK